MKRIFAILLHSVREYKKASLITPVLMLLEVSIECIIPFNIALLINQIKNGCDLETMAGYGLQLFVLATLSLTFGYAAGNTVSTASCGFAKNLRQDMFYKIQDFSFANIDKFSTSSLVTRLTTDVTNVQQAYMMIIRVAIRCPLMFLFSFIMAFVMGGRMGLIFVVTVPILGLGLFYIIKQVMPLFRAVFRKYDALNSSVEEDIRGMRVVKSFVREDYEKERFAKAAGAVCQDFTRAELILAFNAPLMELCVQAGILFVLYFGSYTIITSRGQALDIGQFSALLTYGFMILMNLMMLSMVFVLITMAYESSKRIAEVLQEQSSLTSPDAAVQVVADGSIDFDNVSFKYALTAERMALEGINLHIRSGESIGILGGTGAAKSSLIQLISRLYDVTEGVVRVGGRDVRQYDLEVLRDQVAVVLQKNVLFSGTIKDNLRWGNASATDEELVAVCKIACADEFINQLPQGYATYVEQGGANLSGGQRQRLCIARALLKKPKILILDDSTSAVDTRTDAKIRQAFRQALPHTTKLVIAQRVASVQGADRIVVMDKGRIVALGTHAELLDSCAIYQEVYQSQNKAGEPG